jgi:predicted nucleic acid-binding protein
MKKCLLDSSAISFIFKGTPEKWQSIWNQIKMGKRNLILIEPIIYEIYHKNIQKYGEAEIKKKIIWLKSLKKFNIISLDNYDAILAGSIRVEYSKFNLSLVDCFILSIAKRNGALILTTDRAIRDVGKKINVEVNYLPFE